MHPNGQKICLGSFLPKSFMTLFYQAIPALENLLQQYPEKASASSVAAECSPGALTCCRIEERGQGTVCASVSLLDALSLCAWWLFVFRTRGS